MCEPIEPKIDINIKGIRSQRELMRFFRFCDGKPHMQPLIREICGLFREAVEWADLGDDPVEFLFHEFMLATTEQNFTRALAAKFLLRL